MPEEKTRAQIREEAIRAKVIAGLTREQATDVVGHQAKADEAAANAAKKVSK